MKVKNSRYDGYLYQIIPHLSRGTKVLAPMFGETKSKQSRKMLPKKKRKKHIKHRQNGWKFTMITFEKEWFRWLRRIKHLPPSSLFPFPVNWKRVWEESAINKEIRRNGWDKEVICFFLFYSGGQMRIHLQSSIERNTRRVVFIIVQCGSDTSSNDNCNDPWK